MVPQLGITAIPWALFRNWGILMITASGSGIALLTGLLPKWNKEKWACRTRSDDTYILRTCIGDQHCIVLLGNRHGLDLEDLAGGQNNMNSSANSWTRAAVLTLSGAWTFHLISGRAIRRKRGFCSLLAALAFSTSSLPAKRGSQRALASHSSLWECSGT